MADADLISPPTMRVAAPKPKLTIYYTLLIISLLAMLVACLFLYLEIRRFGGFGEVQGRYATLDRPAAHILSGEQRLCRLGSGQPMAASPLRFAGVAEQGLPAPFSAPTSTGRFCLPAA